MSVVMLRELREYPDELIRRVSEDGEALDVVDDGRIVVRIVPAERKGLSEEALAARMAQLDAIRAEISADWPDGVSAAEAVADQRRDL